jgi:hypothetical protein
MVNTTASHSGEPGSNIGPEGFLKQYYVTPIVGEVTPVVNTASTMRYFIYHNHLAKFLTGIIPPVVLNLA